MLTRQMSITSQTVSRVVNDLVNQVCKNSRKKVSWHPRGISSAATFEIEPWRKINRKPVSLIKENNAFASSPFRLPDEVSVIEPYFDYSKYNEAPRYNMRDRNVLKCLPVTSVDCDLSLDWLGPDDDDDTGPGSGSKLERSRPISLSEVYKIAQQIQQIQEEKEDYDKFIRESEIMYQ